MTGPGGRVFYSRYRMHNRAHTLYSHKTCRWRPSLLMVAPSARTWILNLYSRADNEKSPARASEIVAVIIHIFPFHYSTLSIAVFFIAYIHWIIAIDITMCVLKKITTRNIYVNYNIKANFLRGILFFFLSVGISDFLINFPSPRRS